MTKLKTRLLKDLPVKTTPITDSDYVINSNNGTTKLKVKDITKNLEQNVSKLNSDVKEILEKGTTVETIERATKEEIQKQIASGNMANLTIADGSITSEKIKEVKGDKLDILKSTSVNLFNKNAVNKKGNYNDKGVFDSHYNLWSSDLIRVEPGETYKRYEATGVFITYWGESENFISGAIWQGNAITIPNNPLIKSVRFGITPSDAVLDNMMFCISSKYPSKYIPYDIYKFTDKIDLSDIKINVYDIEGLKPTAIKGVFKNVSINLFDKTKVNKKGNYNDKGVFGSYFNMWSSDLIRVEPGETYKRTGKNGVYLTYWGESENFISGLAWSSDVITIPINSNIKYVRFAMNGDEDTINKMMFTLKDKYPIEYVSHEMYGLSDELDTSNLSIRNSNIKEPLRANVIDAFYRKSENLFNKDTVKSGSYNTNGVYGSYFGLCGSDFIEVDANETYCRNFTEANYATFWDGDKAFISGITWAANVKTITIPNVSNVKYIFFGMNQASVETCVFMKGNTPPSAYIPYNKYVLNSTIELPPQEATQSKWYGQVLSVIGDSITAGNGLSESNKWCTLVKERLGFSKVNNYGISGIRLTQMATNATISRIDKTTSLIVWGGGTNDFHYNSPLGQLGDKTNSSFYGSLYFIFSELYKNLPNAQVIFTTPIPRLDNINRDETNDIGVKWIDYINAIRETCEYFSIPLLDLYKMSGMKSNKFFSDALHPNINGAIRYADKVCGFIKQL